MTPAMYLPELLYLQQLFSEAMRKALLETYAAASKEALGKTLLAILLSEPKTREEQEMQELIMKALMLPYPIKNLKVEGNRIIVELGEEGEEA